MLGRNKREKDADVYVGLLVWIAVATLLSYVIERLWTDFTSRRYFRCALAPGVVVHELSHVVGCLLTGAKVGRVVLFSPSGGSVEHSKPKMPIVGQPLISLAPIVGCTLALWGVWWVFSDRLALEMADLPAVKFSAAGGAELWQALKDLLIASFRQAFSREFLSLEGLLFLYCVLTFSIGMAPSRTDLRHALLGLVAVGAIVFLAGQLGFSSWQVGAEVSHRITMLGWKVFSFSIVLLMSALAVSIPAAVAGKVFGGSQ